MTNTTDEIKRKFRDRFPEGLCNHVEAYGSADVFELVEEMIEQAEQAKVEVVAGWVEETLQKLPFPVMIRVKPKDLAHSIRSKFLYKPIK